MATPLRSMRLDDDVWAEVLKLRKVYGTDNAALRAVFNLAGIARVKRIEQKDGQVPTITIEKMPADLGVESVITKLTPKNIEYTRGQMWKRGPRQKGDKTR